MNTKTEHEHTKNLSNILDRRPMALLTFATQHHAVTERRSYRLKMWHGNTFTNA